MFSKRKKKMRLFLKHEDMDVRYGCYHAPDYGRKCVYRDDGQQCMTCRYCKAFMSAAVATSLINALDRKVVKEP